MNGRSSTERDASADLCTGPTDDRRATRAAPSLFSSDYLVAIPAFGVPASSRAATLAAQGTTVALADMRAYLSHKPWDDHVLGGHCGTLDAAFWPPSPPASSFNDLAEQVHQAAIDQGFTFLHTNVADSATPWLQALVSNGWSPVETLVTLTANPATGRFDPDCTPLLPTDASPVTRLAQNALATGRIHNDPLIARAVKNRFYGALCDSLMERVSSQELFGRTLRHDGEIAGFAIGSSGVTYGGDRRIGLLWFIVIDPRRRLQGFGKRLLNDFLAAATDQMDICEISTQAGNRGALKLYEQAKLPVAGVIHQLHYHIEPALR